jgi:hypothetical protein
MTFFSFCTFTRAPSLAVFRSGHMHRNTTMTQATHAKTPPHFHAIRASAFLASLSFFWYCRGTHVAPNVTELKASHERPANTVGRSSRLPLLNFFTCLVGLLAYEVMVGSFRASDGVGDSPTLTPCLKVVDCSRPLDGCGRVVCPHLSGVGFRRCGRVPRPLRPPCP